MKKVAIIIPCYNSGEFLKHTIDSFMESTQYPNYRIILVESESTDGTDKLCDEYAKKHKNISVIHTKKEGITKAINTGIKSTTEDEDVYLTQDDVVFFNYRVFDWFKMIINISESDEEIGLIGTADNVGISGEDYLLDFPWLGTWSLYIPRNTINKVGLFDEEFSPGPGDDIDYSYRVNKANLKKVKILMHVFHHRLNEHQNDDIEHIKKRNASYFKRKHNLFPAYEEFNFENQKYLLDKRSFYMGGCFKVGGEIESPRTALKIREITKDFNKTDIILDIGAHTGLMSVCVENGVVFSYEPTLETFEVLNVNSQLNNNEKRIIYPFNFALYSENKKYSIDYNNRNSGENRIKLDDNGQSETRTVDEIFKSKPPQFKIKLMKIDAEGSDKEIVKGAIEVIKKDKPILIVEQDLDDELLKKLNYKEEGKVENNKIYVSK